VSDRLDTLDDGTVLLPDDPTRPFVGGTSSSLDEFASAYGPDPSGGIDLTADEFAAFRKATRR